ncbi:MAG: CpsD/CapB family tyrosine-protein kinase [Bacilli bacterium]|nr:CpsD/CapB family tyrosine-protein kinase [Bacilli bacterium]
MSKLLDIFKKKNNEHYEIFITTRPNSSHAESYRKIPLNLRYFNVDNEPRVIQISSSMPGEYKTTTSTNLAAVYGEAGHKVVLIDCDLRRPKVHRATNLLNDVGLTNYLVDKINYDELIKKSEYGFDVITSGETVPYPHVVLNSLKFQELLNTLRKEYDYIIVDSPPILLVTDSLILSEKVDTTLFVINQKVAKKTDVREALQLLENSKAKVSGVILSNVSKKYINYSHYGKYY